MKLLSLVFAVMATFFLVVILVEVGVTRPKAIIGMGSFAAIFWYYFFTLETKPKNIAAKKMDNRRRDWMGNPRE
jgi:hypothetical protein